MILREVQPKWMKNYKPGYMGFQYSSSEILSKGIAYFERWDRISEIKVSHVFVVIGENMLIEAHMKRGVQYAELTPRFDNPNTQIFFKKPTGWNPDIGHRIVAVAESHVGEKYDTSLIAAHAIAGTFLGRLVKVPPELYELFNSIDEWICSELCAHTMNLQPEYQDVGVLATEECAINPQMLFEDKYIFHDWKKESGQ